MATLASGASVTINLAAGQSIDFSESGSGQVVYGIGATSVRVGGVKQSIGPFSSAQTLSITSENGIINYEVREPFQRAFSDSYRSVVTDEFGNYSDTRLQSFVSAAWKRTEAVVRHIGTSSNNAVAFNQTTGLSASDMSVTIKAEMEADFSAVRLGGLNRAANAINGNTAVVGVTETNAIDTSANIGTPVIGGTAYAQIAPAGTLNGWRSVTWAGASSVNIAAATTGQQFQLSDWIPLGSVARTDGGTRPLLLWRTWRPGAASGNWSFNTCGASARTPSAAMRQRTYIASQAFSDAVTTLGATMSLGTTIVPVFPIVRFDVAVLSVWGIGDSTMQGNAQAPDGLSTWGMKACADVSTPAKPVVWANFGASSQTGQTAWDAAKAALAAGFPAPSVFVIEAASVNDPTVPASPTPRDRESEISRALEVISVARQYGVPFVIFVPLMPFNSLNLANDNFRKGTNAEIANIAQANGITVLDFSALGDGASPERWIPIYNDGPGASGDGIHPDETAFDEVMAPRLSAVLRAIID